MSSINVEDVYPVWVFHSVERNELQIHVESEDVNNNRQLFSLDLADHNDYSSPKLQEALKADMNGDSLPLKYWVYDNLRDEIEDCLPENVREEIRYERA